MSKQEGYELVLLANVLAIEISEGLSVQEINTFITFLAALQHNLVLIVAKRDPDDIIL